MSPLAAVQQIYTRYKAIADDTLYLGDGRPRAIFEVHPPNLALADADTLESTALRRTRAVIAEARSGFRHCMGVGDHV